MSYNYENERAELFNESGQVMFLKIRDRVHHLLKEAGAFRAEHAMSAAGSGSSWQMLACLDRLVELKEIREVTAPGSCWGQNRVFVDATASA